MMMKKYITRLATLALVGGTTAALTACEDLLHERPPNLLTAENLYSSPAGFQAGLNGLYSLVRQEHQGLNGGGNNEHRQLFWTTGVDNALGRGDGVGQFVSEPATRARPDNAVLRLMWNWLYSTINASNTLIERAENPQVRLTAAEKNRIVGEARFIRAYAYRHLTYLWGDVPLHLTESAGDVIKTDWERAPVAEVRKQMEEDLLFAEQHIPMTNGERITRGTAQHFLAELYLATGENGKAEEKAAAVINSRQYSLITRRYGIRGALSGVPFMDQFYDGNALRRQGNTETLWPVENEQNVTGGGANQNRRAWVQEYNRLRGITFSVEHGGRGVARGRPTRWALELYCLGDSRPADCLNPQNLKSREPDDHRGSKHALRRYYIYNLASTLPAGARMGDTLWLAIKNETVSANDADLISTRKWDWADPNALSTQGRSWPDVAFLRLAETYLVLAEAQFKQGKLAQAAENINIVRTRSNASLITPADVTLDFILDERSRELLAEEHRRYTLLRTGKYLERTRKYNPLVGAALQDHHVLLPIPQSVIDANLTRKMEQNPGY